MRFFHITTFFAITLLFISCSKKGEISVDQATISFVNTNQKVIGFGKLNYQTLLEKIEYKSIPKIGGLLTKEIDGIGNSIELKTPIYYALEATNTESQFNFYSFIQVKNQDSLVDRLTKMGFFVENFEQLKIMKDGDVTIGIQSNLAIAMIKKASVDSKKEMVNLFKIAQEKPKKGSIVEEFLAKKGDLSYTTRLESFYSDPKFTEQINPAKKDEFIGLTKNSYIFSALNFESGKISFISENFFSKALQDKMFLDGSHSASFINEVGGGAIKVGLSTNINTLKLETFLDDYFPEIKREKIVRNQEVALGLMLLGENPLTKLFSGKSAIVMSGNPTGMIMGFVPDINFFVELGDKKARPLYEIAMANQAKSVNYTITDFAMKGASKESTSATQKAKYPSCAADFGKKGISLFVDIKALQIEEFGFSNGLQTLELVDNLHVNINNTKSEFIIEFKDRKTNVLKQVRDFYVQDLEKLISQIAL